MLLIEYDNWKFHFTITNEIKILMKEMKWIISVIIIHNHSIWWIKCYYQSKIAFITWLIRFLNCFTYLIIISRVKNEWKHCEMYDQYGKKHNKKQKSCLLSYVFVGKIFISMQSFILTKYLRNNFKTMIITSIVYTSKAP